MTKQELHKIIEKYGVFDDKEVTIVKPDSMSMEEWKEFAEGLEEYLGIEVGYTISFPGVGVLS